MSCFVMVVQVFVTVHLFCTCIIKSPGLDRFLVCVISEPKFMHLAAEMSAKAKELSTSLDVITQHTNNNMRDERKQPHV